MELVMDMSGWWRSDVDVKFGKGRGRARLRENKRGCASFLITPRSGGQNLRNKVLESATHNKRSALTI